ncbi:MAG TPA: WbqC family protein [Usitatibacter sp.]|nr:WbqC family protein [Usitatibacter sp.]
MLVAVHQPHYVPWLGYLDRMVKADLFIVLDHVQFERRNYQNRTKIRLEGEGKWLTVPVVQVSQKETILEKAIDNSEEGSRAWGPNHFKTMRYAYRKAPYFEQYAPQLQQILEARWDKLVDLNLAMLDFVREAFEVRTPLRRSSQMRAEGAKSELLLNLCREVAPGSTFLGGLGGSRDYLNHEAFAREGIGVKWQDFKHPVYPQCGEEPFMPGLMSLDALFNCGPRAVELLHAPKVGHEERIAA